MTSECPVVVDGRPCVSGQRIVRGECLYHYKQRFHARPITEWKPRRRRGAASERDELGRKNCPRCDTWKPVESFTPSSSTPDRLQSWCSGCAADYMSLNRYGITRAQVEAMVTEQGGCAICRRPDPGGSDYRRGWHVDHDHACCSGGRNDRTCGKCVRGILCGRCNKLIGTAGDDPNLLRLAIGYLAGRRCEASHQGKP